jgi:hypothetical protein
MNLQCEKFESDDTYERKGSLCKHRKEAEESAFGSCDTVELDKWTRVQPVSETDAVVVGPATQIKHDAKDDETYDRDDLD